MSKKIRIYESEIKRAVRRGLMENIAGVHEVVEKSVTQYDFEKDGDLEQFNTDLDTADAEDVNVGVDGAQIQNEEEEEEIVSKVKGKKKPTVGKKSKTVRKTKR